MTHTRSHRPSCCGDACQSIWSHARQPHRHICDCHREPALPLRAATLSLGVRVWERGAEKESRIQVLLHHYPMLPMRMPSGMLQVHQLQPTQIAIETCPEMATTSAVSTREVEFADATWRAPARGHEVSPHRRTSQNHIKVTCDHRHARLILSDIAKN